MAGSSYGGGGVIQPGGGTAGLGAGSGGAGKLPDVGPTAKKTLGLISGMPGQNIGQQYLPQFQAGAKQLANLANPSAGPAKGVMAGANQGAAFGKDTASDVYGFSQGLIPYAQQIQQMGFDPQQELYNRTLQQVQEQQRAGQAARGIGMSPYGAGLEGDATRNFNIDWQNAQLKRATDAGAASSALGSSAFNLGSGATDLAAAAGRLPYEARTGLVNDRINAYANVGNQVTGANQPRQQTIADFLQYLGMGPGYQSSAASQQSAGNQTGLGLLSILPAMIGK